MKPKNRAGEVRLFAGVCRQGRQEADLQGKKRKHGRLRFFLPFGPRLRPGAAPPPLSRGRTGLRPERPKGVERANPSYLSFERGKPGGEGEGQYMAAGKPPPDRAYPEGCAVPGGRSRRSSPGAARSRERGCFGE